MPATRCGVVGFRPTYGRVSNRGVIPFFPSADTVGPIARSVRDSAILLHAIAGYDPADATSADRPVPNFDAAVGMGTTALRVGTPAHPYFDALDPEVGDAVSDALKTIRHLAKSVVDVKLPEVPSFALDCELRSYHEHLLADFGSAYNPVVRARIEQWSGECGPSYVETKRALELARRQIGRVFADIDLLVTPTTANLPRSIEETLQGESQSSFLAGRNTYPISMWGLPAISVPCGFSRAGLPIGLQIAGAPFQESKVFALAHAFERSSEWHTKRPEL